MRMKQFFDDFNQTKDAVERMERNIKQGKASGNQVDFKFWRHVVRHTEGCIKDGGKEEVGAFHFMDFFNTSFWCSFVGNKQKYTAGGNLEKNFTRKSLK